MTVRFRRTFTVDRPIEAVFAYAADFRNAAAWDPIVGESTATTADPYGVGSELLLLTGLLGGRTAMRFTVTEHEPPARVRIRGAGRRWTSVDTITFSPVAPGATTVVYEGDVTLTGALRLASPVVGLALELGGSVALRGLRKALHSLPPAG